MKLLFTLLFSAAFFTLSAQVRVDEKSVNIEGSKNGFYISIPYGDQKQVDNALKEELKNWKGKFTTPSGYILVEDCSMKDVSDHFTTWAKVEANPDGGAFVSLAIDLGGAFLSSSEHAAQYKIVHSRLLAFGISAAKSVVDSEIKAQEEILKAKQKELADLETDQAKREKENEEMKNKIAENEKAIEESKKNQEAKKVEITTQEGVVQEVVKKKEAIK
jgi:hypothetical protein